MKSKKVVLLLFLTSLILFNVPAFNEHGSVLSQREGARAIEGKRAVGSADTHNTVVILVKFSDVTNTRSVKEISTRIFSSLNDYWKSISYQQSGFVGHVLSDWYRLPNPLAYYGSGGFRRERIWELVRDAVEVGASLGVQYRNYELIVIVHAGRNEVVSKSDSDITSFGYQREMFIDSPDGRLRRKICVVSEFDPIGVIAHQIGHTFGLPDLYNYNLTQWFDMNNDTIVDEDNCVGHWDLMATGQWLPNSTGEDPTHPTIWTKNRLGWIQTIRDVYPSGESVTAQVDPLENPTETGYSFHGIRVHLTEDLYYLAEVRKPSHGRPGGVLVYEVDDTLALQGGEAPNLIYRYGSADWWNYTVKRWGPHAGRGPLKIMDANPTILGLYAAPYQDGQRLTIPHPSYRIRGLYPEITMDFKVLNLSTWSFEVTVYNGAQPPTPPPTNHFNVTVNVYFRYNVQWASYVYVSVCPVRGAPPPFRDAKGFQTSFDFRQVPLYQKYYFISAYFIDFNYMTCYVSFAMIFTPSPGQYDADLRTWYVAWCPPPPLPGLPPEPGPPIYAPVPEPHQLVDVKITFGNNGINPDVWVTNQPQPTPRSGYLIPGKTNYVWALIRNDGPDNTLEGEVEVQFSYYDFEPDAALIIAGKGTPFGSAKCSIAAGGSAKVSIAFTPDKKEHYCFEVEIEVKYSHDENDRNNQGYANFGVSSASTMQEKFTVYNPYKDTNRVYLHIMSDIPPGWIATLDKSVVTLSAWNTIGERDDITLTVIPPPGAPLGTNATFSVVSMIGDRVIGGLSLQVVVEPHFTISVNPSSQTVGLGQSTTFTVTLASLHGFNQKVSLNVSNLPAYTTGSFNSSSLSGNASSTLTVSTSPSTPPGTYTLTIWASALGKTHTVDVTLNVRAGFGQTLTAIFSGTDSVGFMATGNIYDDSSLGFMYAHRNPPKRLFPKTDSVRINQVTKAPTWSDYTHLVMVGGRAANPTLAYYEDNGMAPLKFYIEGGQYIIKKGATVVYTINPATITPTQDYFVMEVIQDGAHTVISLWGIGAPGTYCAGVYFDGKYIDLASLTAGWYIVRWQDLNRNGLPDYPGEFSVVASEA